MRTLLLICALLTTDAALAARLNGCDTAVRVGQKLLREGDDVGRALSAIRRSSTLRWVRGPTGNRWTLTRRGHNPRTVHIQIKRGRIEKLCQYTG